MRIYFLALSLIIFVSCNQNKIKQHDKKHKLKSTAFKDTLIVTKRSAISVWLDTATLEKRKKISGDDGFYAGADDDVNYSANVDSILKARNLTVVDVLNYKYLKFIQNNGKMTLVKIDTLPQIYTLYFFDPGKAPQQADVTNVEDSYKKFY